MGLTIDIPDSEFIYLQDLYGKRYYDIIKQQNELEDRLRQMKPLLIQFGIIEDEPKAKEPTLEELNGYDPSWKWLDKIQYLLEKANGPKTSNEIINEILKREPNESKARLINSVPATLSTAVNTPSTYLKRKKNARGEYEYWVEEDLPF